MKQVINILGFSHTLHLEYPVPVKIVIKYLLALPVIVKTQPKMLNQVIRNYIF